MSKRGPKTSPELENEIIILKREDNSLTAKEIKGELARLHPQLKNIPKEGAIYKIIKRNVDRVTSTSTLDKPWSLGACLEYGIKPEYVLPIQWQLAKYRRYLTIRRARWYSVLHPLLMPVLEREHPRSDEENQMWLFQIAGFYSRAEQVAEIKGDNAPDTRLLDDKFLYHHDISFATIADVFCELYLLLDKPVKAADTPTAEAVLAEEITPSQGKLLRQFIKLLYDALMEKAVELAEENPSLQAVAQKWMALSLRREIYKNLKGR